jgi:hypothetical protein
MIDEEVVRPRGVATEALTQALQRLLKHTESAIRDRLFDEPALEANLRERHAAAVRGERTDGSATGYNAFADEAISQAAVHWLLGCLFVRFLEDNGWLDERNAKVAWIAGPGERLAIAKGQRSLFLRPDPNLTDRDYLLHVFAEIAKLPGVAGLFDRKHNPLYWLQPATEKGRGAARIVEFFQQVDPDTGRLVFDFTDPNHGTRFLGDLYQNLSEYVRERYKLCQTPSFVIDFILDRTLTPALDAFGLEAARLIDPSCGSGHFLLATFERLFRLWQSKEPGTNSAALAQRTLDAIFGVDLNPHATEISRFRLLIAALVSSGINRLKEAPHFRFNVASGDSLLHGSRLGGGGIERHMFEDRLQHFYETEDAEDLRRILGQQYHVVVGNPPYMNVKDAILREAYRKRFLTCHGKYQLGVPFTERFFDLTVRTDEPNTEIAGWMGMIVSNAFMKRSFGCKLIENYLRNKDLTGVVDTSGAYLPEHATPTVILFARNRQPVGSIVRTVRGIRAETQVPVDPENAPVWLEIAKHFEEPGHEGQFISVLDAPRSDFMNFPWSIGGGGATELRQRLEESAEDNLAANAAAVGLYQDTHADEAFVQPLDFARRHQIETAFRPLYRGEGLRDWGRTTTESICFPFDNELRLWTAIPSQPQWSWLHDLRVYLWGRSCFGGGTYKRDGRQWFDYHQFPRDRATAPFLLAFADIATHNHFVLDLGGSVFNRHAPIVRLHDGATLDQHLELLGILNSSTACFWLKQVCQSKGSGGIGGGLATELWEYRFEFDGTKLKQFPLPAEQPLELAKLIEAEAGARDALLPDNICSTGLPTRKALDSARDRAAHHLARMIALQEELDWQCYRLYGLIDADLNVPPHQVPPLKVGQRAFEIRMAREIEGGTLETSWFQRHHSRPTTEFPTEWQEQYRAVCARRLVLMQQSQDIGLIEQPAYKRRWNLPLWDDLEKTALKNWLLDQMETNPIWLAHTPISCGQLRDALAQDADWLSVAQIYNGGPIEDLSHLVVKLAVSEAVPFLPQLRYTEAGLRRRSEWTDAWDLQRREDAGEAVEISPPSKYRSSDFQRTDYWRLRGGLDVQQERFILYPSFERDADASPVLGWAGWSHLDQARALAAYYQRMRTEEGWEPERLKPILAGLLDLREWLRQWHDNLDPEMGLKLGTYFSEFAEAQCQELGFSPQEVLAWQPPDGKTRGRKKRAKRND